MSMPITASRVFVLGALSGLVAALAFPVKLHAQARQSDTIYCASNSDKYQECPTSWRDARLVRQESKSACVRGKSWGTNRQGLWVKNGCRGRFAEVEYGRGHGYGDRHDRHHDSRYGSHHDARRDSHHGWNRQIQLQCDSNKKRYQLCQVDVGRHGTVRLVHQMSDARCTKGYSWGYNRAGVWVSHGCRAKFVVDRRW